MNCQQCDKLLRARAAFCDNCGARVPTIVEESTLSLDVHGADKQDGRIGRVIGGKYKLLALLGRGGMSSVYRGRRIHIGDDVAVKVLHGEYLKLRA